MRKLGLVMAMAFAMALASSCGGKKDEEKAPAEQTDDEGGGEEAEPECDVDDDCRRGKICLDGECTGTERGGVYHNPRKSVTPAKVKREVEKRMKQGEKRLDRGLEMDE